MTTVPNNQPYIVWGRLTADSVPQSGVTITLTVYWGAGGSVSDTRITDSTGYYIFDDIKGGQFLALTGDTVELKEGLTNSTSVFIVASSPEIKQVDLYSVTKKVKFKYDINIRKDAKFKYDISQTKNVKFKYDINIRKDVRFKYNIIQDPQKSVKFKYDILIDTEPISPYIVYGTILKNNVAQSDTVVTIANTTSPRESSDTTITDVDGHYIYQDLANLSLSYQSGDTIQVTVSALEVSKTFIVESVPTEQLVDFSKIQKIFKAKYDIGTIPDEVHTVTFGKSSYIKIYDASNYSMMSLQQANTTSVSISEKLNNVSSFQVTLKNNAINRSILSNYRNEDLYICYNHNDDFNYPLAKDNRESSNYGNSYQLSQIIALTQSISEDLLTLSFDLKSDGVNTAYARIIKNGITIYDNIPSIGNYATKDIKLDNIAEGDVFELHIKSSSTSGTAYAKNFRLYRDYKIFTAKIAGNSAIEYNDRHTMKIAGYAKPVELSYSFFEHIRYPFIPRSVLVESSGVKTNYTSESVDPTQNDITIPIVTGTKLFIGHWFQFNTIEIDFNKKRSYTYAIPSNTLRAEESSVHSTKKKNNYVFAARLPLINKEIYGSVRIKFDVAAGSQSYYDEYTNEYVTAYTTAYAKVMKNSNGVLTDIPGTSVSVSSGYTTFTFDKEISLGITDTLELWYYVDVNHYTYKAFVKNFQLLYNEDSTSDEISSIQGIYDGTYIWKYYNGTNWVAVPDIVDETDGFSRIPGTRHIFAFQTPSDQAISTIIDKNGLLFTGYYFTFEVLSSASVDTNPSLNTILLGQQDPFQIKYLETPANEILQDVVNDINTWNKDDPYRSVYFIAECPTDKISIQLNYETKLKWVSEIANTLSWTDTETGNKHNYDWWIDNTYGIHIAQLRQENYTEEEPYDISANLEILNKKESYIIANRIFGLGKEDSGVKIVTQNFNSQDTYMVRDMVISDNRYTIADTLRNKLNNEITKVKDPIYTYDCSMPYYYYFNTVPKPKIGDWLLINQPEWNTNNAIERIQEFSYDFDELRLIVKNTISNVESMLNEQQQSSGNTQKYAQTTFDNPANIFPVDVKISIGMRVTSHSAAIVGIAIAGNSAYKTS